MSTKSRPDTATQTCQLIETAAGLRLNVSGLGDICSAWDSPRDLARIQRAKRANEPLLRAISPKGKQWHVVDATAGLGRDSALLLQAGHQVTALEQNPDIHALLQNVITRLQLKLQLHQANAVTWLNNQPKCCDAVYLDPMYPARNSKALVRKGMQGLQQLIGSSTEEERLALLQAASGAATKRIVFKRPADIPALSTDTLKPHHQIDGGQIILDVYQLS